MSLPQDVFGASPKTVLNKPFFHAQHREPTSTGGGSSIVGITDRPLNTVLNNNISGASLADGGVLLPAGEYYIEGSLNNYSTTGFQRGRPYVRDSTDNILIVGTGEGHNSGTSSKNHIWSDSVAGKITLTEPTTLKLSSYSTQAIANGIGYPFGQAPYELHADLRIWKLDSDIDTPVLSDPTMTLARPLMQAQERYPQGTTTIQLQYGNNDIPINTEIVNQIAGASLAGGSIVLPAGTYTIMANFLTGAYQSNSATVLDLVDDAYNVLVPGVTVKPESANVNAASNLTAHCSGRFTITQQTTVKLRQYSVSLSGSTPPSRGIDLDIAGREELFTQLMIWQEDAVVRTPVLVNDKLFPLPGTVQVTGNMYGLDYAKTGANEVTIQPGACMNSTNEVALQLASAQALSIPAAASTIYNLFLCDDGFVRQDTDENGAGLVGYKVRWIGFVRNDSTGEIILFTQDGDIISFADPINDMVVVSANVPTAYTQADWSPWVPVTRVFGTKVFCSKIAENGVVILSSDGSTERGRVSSSATAGISGQPNTLEHGWYYKAQSSTSDSCEVCLSSTRLKR